MNSFIQADFRGGINLFNLDHAIGENEYSYAYNVRSRDNSLSPIKKPLEDADAPVGKKQALQGFDEYLILGNNGRLYYKNTALSSDTWHPIPNANLNSNASRLYMQAVPATPKQMRRKLRDESIVNGTSADTGVDVVSDIIVDGAVSGVVVQDGISQPYFVYRSGTGLTSRKLSSYNKWNNKSNKEYVPIGKQMAYMNGILFIVAPNGKEIYRSVSGCPLDFVVNVTATGEKGGDATTTSFSVSPYEITSLIPLTSGELFVGTLERCYPIEFNYDSVIFQEPTFYNRRAFAAGIVGQHCYVDVLGDGAFIDTDGLRSFNAISTIQNEGRNTIFSLNISRLFKDIVQSTESSAITFDNYALFSVDSVIGSVVLVYDMLAQKWISIDRYGINKIRQFASTKLSYDPTIYAITSNKLYKLFSDADELTATIYFKSNFIADATKEVLLSKCRTVFANVTQDVPVKIYELYNGFLGAVQKATVKGDSGTIKYPVEYAVAFREGNTLQNVPFTFQGQSRNAFKIGAVLSWTGPCKLIMWQMDTEITSYQNPLIQQAKIYKP